MTPHRSRAGNKTRIGQPNYWKRQMRNRNGWTPERRAKQRSMIQSWKPWRQSTGPRTPEGKARASRNRWRGGTRAMLRIIARALREQSETLAEL